MRVYNCHLSWRSGVGLLVVKQFDDMAQATSMTYKEMNRQTDGGVPDRQNYHGMYRT